MRKFIWLIPILVVLAGCTAPTQPLAAQSLQVGADQEHSIVYDLATMARQSATNVGVAEAQAAALASDPELAKKAVEKAVSEFDKVLYLLVQHERARALIRVGQRFVWEQKGVVNIMIDEFKEAKKRSDEKEETRPVGHEILDIAHGR